MRRLLAAPLAMLAFTAALPAQAPVTFDEWEVPYERSRPRDPYVAPDGSVFFVGQVGNYIARLDQKSGQFTRFEIDSTSARELAVGYDVHDDGTIDDQPAARASRKRLGCMNFGSGVRVGR